MKRGNEHGDLSKEQFAQMEEESTEGGVWQPASKEEIATRRILKISRRSGNETAFPSIRPSNDNTINPFASFVIPKNQEAAPSSVPSMNQPNKQSIGETDSMKKLKKLNESFLLWVERQMKEKAVAVWKDGVKDYIKYAANLKESVKDVETKQPLELNKDSVSTGAVVDKSAGSQTSSSAAPAFNFTLQSESDHKPALVNSSAPPPFSLNLPSWGNEASKPSPFNWGFNSFSTEKKENNSTGGFPNFTTTPFNASNSSQAKQDEGNADGEEEYDGEPILPPEKILKNESDTDEILLEVPCKLFGFNQEEKEWKDIGKGSFRITQDPTTKKKRMLVRNTTGKITFNAAFYRDMKVDLVKNGIKLLAIVSQVKDPSKTELKSFMFKLKEADISTVKSFIEGIVKEL